MEKKVFGIVVRVKDLDVCRHFYGNILRLGSPVVDSNIWVEYLLPDSGILALEKIDGKADSKQGNIAWFFQVDNVETFLHRLKDHGYTPEEEMEESLGFKLYKFHDPENNPFMIFPTPEFR